MPGSFLTPVTVLTGFLGSGKTTLLARMVRDPRFADTALIVNEWGEAPIDHAILRQAGESIQVMAGGCVCCRAAGDVVRALRELHFQRAAGAIPEFRRVVMETTGLADPAPLLATLVEMPVVAARYALSGVVATVDAEHGAATLDRHAEAVKQVAMADRLVLTKVDRVADERALAALEERLRALNPRAPLLRSRMGDADPGLLLHAGLYRGEGLAPDARGWLGSGAYRIAGGGARHDAGIGSFEWRCEEPRPWHDVETALETLLDLQGERILRLKGLVNVAGEAGPRAVHAVHHTLYPPARLAEWPDADRATRLVLIGRHLDPAAVDAILRSFLPQPPRPHHGEHAS